MIVTTKSQAQLVPLSVTLNEKDISSVATISLSSSNSPTTPSTTTTTREMPTAKDLVGKQRRLRKDTIARIARATDAQAHGLAKGHVRATIASEEGFDVVRLANACNEVTWRHPVLRTVFAQHGDELYQVVLTSPPADVVMLNQTEESVAAFEGDELPRFRFLASPDKRCHKLYIDLSHAHYDAISLKLLIENVEAHYTGVAVAPAPDYLDYLSHVDSLDKGASLKAWRKVLQGSSMTHIAPSTSTHPQASVSSSASIAKTASGSIANTLQSAWALALSQVTGSKDVVFGTTTENRNLPFPGVERVPGPLSNVVPVRVQLPASSTSFDSLVQQVQKQAESVSSHHHVSWQTLFQQCTDWPSSTRFGSVVSYQNAQPSKVQLGSVSGTLSVSGESAGLADVSLVVKPASTKGELDIKLAYSHDVLSEEQAQALLKGYTAILEAFSKNPELSIDQVSRITKNVEASS